MLLRYEKSEVTLKVVLKNAWNVQYIEEHNCTENKIKYNNIKYTQIIKTMYN